MRDAGRTVRVLVLLAATNPVWSTMMIEAESGFRWDVLGIIWLAAFAYINVRPLKKGEPTKRNWYLRSGAELLQLFWITATANFLLLCAYCAYFRSVLFDEVRAGMFFKGIWVQTILNLTGMAVLESILFWNGIMRIFRVSGCIDTRHRVLAVLCGWIPFLNIWYLTKIIRTAATEAEESEREERGKEG